MRFPKIAILLACSLLLAGCVPSLIIGNQLQSKLMWAFIKPLVGFNPNDINFFEAPLVKERMTALLGDKYEPTMKLLATARQIQQEGALFYVVSHYVPPELAAVKTMVDSAGMVWNADTNQMAVLLVKDGVPELISEQVQAGRQALVPALPTQLSSVYEQALAAKRTMDMQKQQLENAEKLLERLPQQLESPQDPLLELIEQKRQEALDKAVN